ncbi:MAG TPA: glycosyltransferase [Saprospiraceae bacterium]|nr:glycosyltransferase [Saprospiraceae bacterium]
MKLIVLTSRFPFPLEKGDKLRAYHQIRELSRRYEITLVALSEQPVLAAHITHLQTICQRVEVLLLPHWRLPGRLLRGLGRAYPLQVAYFFSPHIQRQIQQLITEVQPDAVYCQLIRMAPYAEQVSGFKVLDYMDAFSAGMQRRAAQSKSYLKWLFRWEAKRLQDYESAVFQHFNHCSIISVQDRDLLAIADKARIRIVPNGVDTLLFTNKTDRLPQYDLVFVGNMGYHPNVEAARWLVHELLPVLHQNRPQLRLLIAGARPTAAVQSLQNERVTVAGWMDDIREAYSNARVFVAPIFLGSGQQNKILEAMSMQLPCITTPMVNNAIGAPVNKAILIASTAQDFAQQVHLLLENAKLRAQIGREARTFVEQKYSWQHSVSILTELFDKNNAANEF